MAALFGNGTKGKECNALLAALISAAGGETKIYVYSDETPKKSLVVELVEELNKHGYHILKSI